ncbi:MAG: helicase RepA family protein [Clostridia bacterium]|nr:helicase RepA family protein [Clostridia bacterium]
MKTEKQMLIAKIRAKLPQYIKEMRLEDSEGRFRCFKCSSKNMKSRTEYYATAQIEYFTNNEIWSCTQCGFRGDIFDLYELAELPKDKASIIPDLAERFNISIDKSKKFFQTIDGESLLAMPIDPIKNIVPGLIPQGLHLLAGSPKIGKSWLTLWICLQIAKGKPIWNFEVQKGTTLYLCLEDSIQRIQNRLLLLTDEAPQSIHFATMAENIENGLVEQIENFIYQYPDTVLIVIDTLQRIRGYENDGNAYANDYKDINILKEIADRYRIAILLVHHLRKMSDNDPFNMVSGTTGLTGAVDGSLVLIKDKRNTNKAILYAVGRDIEYKEMALEFQKEHVWELIDCDAINDNKTSIVRENPVINSVVKLINSQGDWQGTASELLEKIQEDIKELSIHPSLLSKTLNQCSGSLLQAGIKYNYRRTSQRKIISLIQVNDGNLELQPGI